MTAEIIRIAPRLPPNRVWPISRQTIRATS